MIKWLGQDIKKYYETLCHGLVIRAPDDPTASITPRAIH